jgi:hypothetical protein
MDEAKLISGAASARTAATCYNELNDLLGYPRLGATRLSFSEGNQDFDWPFVRLA